MDNKVNPDQTVRECDGVNDTGSSSCCYSNTHIGCCCDNNSQSTSQNPELRRLVVVSERYPTPGDPTFTFLDSLLVEMRALGIEMHVIVPRSISRDLVYKKHGLGRVWTRHTPQGDFTIHQPYYLSMSRYLKNVNRKMFWKAISREAHHLKFSPQAVYAHFWYSGMGACMAYPKETDPKVFVACGESQSAFDRNVVADPELLKKRVSGVISVSTANVLECEKRYGIPGERIKVFPNGVDLDRFHPLSAEERLKVRKELGVAPEETLVAFVGSFDERKGVLRVQKALEGLSGIRAMYIGSGKLVPEDTNIVYCGHMEHDRVSTCLAASDMFVLPTRSEGCCNAIIEAMACGLPIISSVGEFNDDILQEAFSLRVDPNDVTAIRKAVQTLQTDPALREEMGKKACAFAGNLSVSQRAKRIKEFIEEHL